MLFFVDELGPLAIKKHQGVCQAVRLLSYREGFDRTGGSFDCDNVQMPWCFTRSKDTMAVIDLINNPIQAASKQKRVCT
jgi:hypothetical protein